MGQERGEFLLGIYRIPVPNWGVCCRVVYVCVRGTGALPSSVGEIEVSDFRNWVVGFDATPGVLVRMCEECIVLMECVEGISASVPITSVFEVQLIVL